MDCRPIRCEKEARTNGLDGCTATIGDCRATNLVVAGAAQRSHAGYRLRDEPIFTRFHEKNGAFDWFRWWCWVNCATHGSEPTTEQ